MDDPFGKLAIFNQLEKVLAYEDPLTSYVWILATGFWNDAVVWVDGDVWIDAPPQVTYVVASSGAPLFRRSVR
jgi:hypothetical protein